MQRSAAGQCACGESCAAGMLPGMSEARHIQVLPIHVANKIAAGEVVDRPASVVKELMENALDAGARQVDLEVVAGGRKLVAVSDSGRGMNRDVASLIKHGAKGSATCIEMFKHDASNHGRNVAESSLPVVFAGHCRPDASQNLACQDLLENRRGAAPEGTASGRRAR